MHLGLDRNPRRPGRVEQGVQVPEVRLRFSRRGVIAQQAEDVVEIVQRKARRVLDRQRCPFGQIGVVAQHSPRGSGLDRDDAECVAHGVVQLASQPVAFAQLIGAAIRSAAGVLNSAVAARVSSAPVPETS